MVTHDPKAASIADRLLFLSDGTIVKDLAGADEDHIVDAMKGL
jgi:putative ABC transport system ATP-binding protein